MLKDQLIKMDVRTCIAQIPQIIQTNNDAICAEFDTIRDKDNCMILDVSANSVSSRDARFTNLNVAQLNIIDTSGGQNLKQYISSVINEIQPVSLSSFATPVLGAPVNENKEMVLSASEPVKEYDLSSFFSATVKGKLSGVTTDDLYGARLYRMIDDVRIPLSIGSIYVGKKLRLCVYHDHIENSITYKKIARVFVAIMNNADKSGIVQYGAAETIDFKI